MALRRGYEKTSLTSFLSFNIWLLLCLPKTGISLVSTFYHNWRLYAFLGISPLAINLFSTPSGSPSLGGEEELGDTPGPPVLLGKEGFAPLHFPVYKL
jgi:hypothetical protein